MITKIYTQLKTSNLNSYWPGQHQGLCDKRYCVVKENIQVAFPNTRVGYRLLDIIVFVPISSYVQVAPYVREIKAALKEFPLWYAGETPIIPDDEKKAYTTSIQYQILKKMEG